LTANDLKEAFNIFGHVLVENLEKGFEGLYSRMGTLNHGPSAPEPQHLERQKNKRSALPNRRSFDQNHMAVMPCPFIEAVTKLIISSRKKSELI
jgi:hypothetical protein